MRWEGEASRSDSRVLSVCQGFSHPEVLYHLPFGDVSVLFVDKNEWCLRHSPSVLTSAHQICDEILSDM